MFSKDEAKRLRIDFWTAFGVYMRQHVSWLGPKQKWVNYHTGVKGIFFRLEADKRSVQVAITLEHDDPGIRALFFEQFLEMRVYLTQETGLDWVWEPSCLNVDGKEIARISRTLADVSLYRPSDWGTMFAFLEAGIVPLDQLWAECQDVFKDLAD